jgi:hypothetical protein
LWNYSSSRVGGSKIPEDVSGISSKFRNSLLDILIFFDMAASLKCSPATLQEQRLPIGLSIK